MHITNLDNFSAKWEFKLPEEIYPVLFIKQTADIVYSSVTDIESWPFNANIITEFKDEAIDDTYTKMRIEVNDNIGKPIVFYKKDFIAKENPVISDRFVTRSPLIEQIKVTFKYEVPISTGILGFCGLVFIAILPKAIYTDIIIVLYTLAFSPVTASVSSFFYAIFTGFYVVVMYRHVEKHTVSNSNLNKFLNPTGWVSFALFAIYAFFTLGFTPFQISSSPCVILVGMCLIQVVGLIAFTQINIPIMFDFIGGLCVYLPYVLQVFLPIYISNSQAVSVSTTGASVLGLLGVMCSILSEGLLERDDIVSEDVMGVIARETSSSSGGMVTIERDDSLKIGKVRRVNPVSLTIVALPCIFGVGSIIISQLQTIDPATFQIIKDN
jgi:hypothetical protein